MILPAHVESYETGDTLDDPALLSQLDGVREIHNLADLVQDSDLPSGIQILSAVPILRFDSQQRQLALHICFETDREADNTDRGQIAAFLDGQVQGGWGTTYEFEMPTALDGFAVHFADQPIEDLATPHAEQLAKLVAAYRGWSFATLEKMTDEELESLVERLSPHAVRNYRSTGPARAVWDLYEAAQAQKQRRAASRSAAPRISMDDLDELDDLPDDVF